MTLDPPFTVRVERHDTALANAMKEMPIWLDNTRLQPVEFKIAIAAVNRHRGGTPPQMTLSYLPVCEISGPEWGADRRRLRPRPTEIF